MNPTIETMLATYKVTRQTREFISAGHQKMFIDGEFCESDCGETSTVEDPSNGCPLMTVPRGTAADTDRAVTAAKTAFQSGPWAEMTPGDRQNLMLKLADVMEEHAQTIAEIEAIDAGKAIGGCYDVDILSTIDHIRFMAGWATKIEGNTRDISTPNTFAFTLKEPVGVVGAIVPWNWPLNMAFWKMAAALAVGCTLVLKPAEMTPMSILYVMKIFKEAGLPDGVINIVTGKGSVIGNRLAAHPDVSKVSFTGSTPTGQTVGKAAIEGMKHLTLELGGKSAMVAFEDADVDAIVEGAHASVFFNAGQVCSAGSRLYVHKEIYQATIDALVASLNEVVIGDPLNPDTTQGPQISKGQFDSVMHYIGIGKEEGATLAFGGNAVEREGYFIEPTLFTDCNNGMTIVQEEIFGPVLTVIPFETEAEAVRLANDNIYGLSGSVFTKDLSRAIRVTRQLETGSVCINAHDIVDVAMPFGGYKMSGIGKDMGREQLDHFLETKSVIVQL